MSIFSVSLRLTHARLFDRHNLVIAPIKRRSNQVVHAGIDNSEFLRACFFDVTHAGQQYASVSYKKTARLDQDTNIKLAQRWNNCLSVIADAERKRFVCRARATICLIRSRVRVGKQFPCRHQC